MIFRMEADILVTSYEPPDAVLEPRAMLPYGGVPMFAAPLPQMRFEWLRSKITYLTPLLSEIASRDTNQFIGLTGDAIDNMFT